MPVLKSYQQLPLKAQLILHVLYPYPEGLSFGDLKEKCNNAIAKYGSVEEAVKGLRKELGLDTRH